MTAQLTIEQIIEKAKTSPALTQQWKSNDSFAYPKKYGSKVPLKVKLKMTVMPDIPLIFVPEGGTLCIEGNEYYVWVNKHGAVSAILPNGERLGLKPNEFEVTEYHP
jgi:hypothetical protein